MNQSDINALVGKELIIRSARHLCIGAGTDSLMLLQLNNTGKPIQYIVAHHPDFYESELVWASGDYYLGFQFAGANQPMSTSLREAALCLDDTPLYAAMMSDDWNARCIGVFAERSYAVRTLEKLINQDGEVQHYCKKCGIERLSLESLGELRCEHGWENNYWIEEHPVNKVSYEEEH